MNKQTDRIRKVRQYLLGEVQELTVEQLNEIPASCNNNIIWHLGHLVAAQQGICYVRSNVPPVVEQKYLVLYRSGTKPEAFVDAEEVALIKDLLISTVDQLEADLSASNFTNYTAWTARYGPEITSINDALDFMLFHEGLHLGHIKEMKKLVRG